MHSVLSVTDLSISFDGINPVVDALDLHVNAGETLAIVGESGSGKSITALAVARLLSAQAQVHSGQVLVNKQGVGVLDVFNLPVSALHTLRGRRIGFVFQEPGLALNPVMTVGAQIMEVLDAHDETLKTRTERLDKVVFWLSKVGIPDPEQRVHDYPFQFSGGQKQRVMLAIALAGKPDVLIADEPTTALDVLVQAQILRLIADLKTEFSMAVVLISHDLAVVKHVAQRIMVMRHGHVVESRNVTDFFASETQPPLHPYAAELLLAAKAAQGNTAFSDTNLETAESAEVAETVLSVSNLSFRYAAKQRKAMGLLALDDVSFTLRAGETLAVVGGSGCGKTTLAKSIMGLLPNSKPQSLAQRAHIQMVFQDPFASLNPRMRIDEVLSEGMQTLHPRWDAKTRLQKIEQLLDWVELPRNSMTRFPHEFSGGQRQRIAIARALAVQPQILILDEPTSALDVTVQATVLALLKRLQTELGLAYLLITHNFGVVETFADRVLVMDAGRVVETGDVSAVLRAPQHAITQALLAAVVRI